MSFCCTKRQCEPDVVNKLSSVSLIFAIASPRCICFVHVAANVTILVTQAHENCNHLLRAAACSCKAFIAAAVAADADADDDAAGLY
jgi:hypothetical protein